MARSKHAAANAAPVPRDEPAAVATVHEAIAPAAQLERFELANHAGAARQAIDLCDSLEADTPLEEMLATQMATVHNHAMRALQRSDDCHEAAGKAADLSTQERMYAAGHAHSNAAARLFKAFADATAAFQKLRGGGQQTVTVVHQHINTAGADQVAIAGSVERGQGNGRRI